MNMFISPRGEEVWTTTRDLSPTDPQLLHRSSEDPVGPFIETQEAASDVAELQGLEDAGGGWLSVDRRRSWGLLC